MSQELVSQFSQNLETDITTLRNAITSKDVECSETLLSGLAEKINQIPISYTGTITVNYPTAWNSGYIYYKEKDSSGGNQSVGCNGSGKATITVTKPGTYVITNSHQAEDSTEVVFSAT